MYLATDLHGHSRFSDGTAEPEDFVDARHQAGVPIVALTDHDIFAGVPQAAATAEAHGQLLIPAMEATSFIHFGQSEAEQLHILAYFPPRMLQNGALFQTFLYRRGVQVQQRWRDFVLTFLDALPTSDYDALDPQRQLQTRPATDFPGLQRLIDLVTKKRPQIFKHLIRSHVRFWTDDKAHQTSTPLAADMAPSHTAFERGTSDDTIRRLAKHPGRESYRSLRDVAEVHDMTETQVTTARSRGISVERGA